MNLVEKYVIMANWMGCLCALSIKKHFASLPSNTPWVYSRLASYITLRLQRDGRIIVGEYSKHERIMNNCNWCGRSYVAREITEREAWTADADDRPDHLLPNRLPVTAADAEMQQRVQRTSAWRQLKGYQGWKPVLEASVCKEGMRHWGEVT